MSAYRVTPRSSHGTLDLMRNDYGRDTERTPVKVYDNKAAKAAYDAAKLLTALKNGS